MIQVPGDKALRARRQGHLQKWAVILIRKRLVEGYRRRNFRRMPNVGHYNIQFRWVDIERGAAQNIGSFKLRVYAVVSEA